MAARGGLDPRLVQQMAIEAGYYTVPVKPRDRQSMLSFGRDEGVRINVYYTTGTVATVLHTRQGKTQLFARNMNETDLKCILFDPRYHTGRRYHRLARSQAFLDKAYTNPVSEYFFKNKAYVRFLKQLKTGYQEIDTVCIGKSCLMVLFNNGDVDWKGSVPKEITDFLQKRPGSLPELVALCPTKSNAFFLQFADGHRIWSGVPDKLDKMLKTSRAVGVDVIALGPKDQFYVKFKDGYEDWWLDNKELRRNIKYANSNGFEVAALSLGSSEYAVKFTDHSWRWSTGVKDILRIPDNCENIHQIVLGFEKDYVAIQEVF